MEKITLEEFVEYIKPYFPSFEFHKMEDTYAAPHPFKDINYNKHVLQIKTCNMAGHVSFGEAYLNFSPYHSLGWNHNYLNTLITEQEQRLTIRNKNFEISELEHRIREIFADLGNIKKDHYS